MNEIMTHIKTKTRKLALLAGSFVVVAATTFGVSAGASASSYDNNNWNDNNYGRDNWSYDNNWNNNDYWSDGSYRHYSSYSTVYDPGLHRWVLIGYNTHRDRWELVYSSDRYESRYSGRDNNYWYND
jgi:hypothetical protein